MEAQDEGKLSTCFNTCLKNNQHNEDVENQKMLLDNLTIRGVQNFKEAFNHALNNYDSNKETLRKGVLYRIKTKTLLPIPEEATKWMAPLKMAKTQLTQAEHARSEHAIKDARDELRRVQEAYDSLEPEENQAMMILQQLDEHEVADAAVRGCVSPCQTRAALMEAVKCYTQVTDSVESYRNTMTNPMHGVIDGKTALGALGSPSGGSRKKRRRKSKRRRKTKRHSIRKLKRKTRHSLKKRTRKRKYTRKWEAPLTMYGW